LKCGVPRGLIANSTAVLLHATGATVARAPRPMVTVRLPLPWMVSLQRKRPRGSAHPGRVAASHGRSAMANRMANVGSTAGQRAADLQEKGYQETGLQMNDLPVTDRPSRSVMADLIGPPVAARMAGPLVVGKTVVDGRNVVGQDNGAARHHSPAGTSSPIQIHHSHNSRR
jgi:hypothetical protein